MASQMKLAGSELLPQELNSFSSLPFPTLLSLFHHTPEVGPGATSVYFQQQETNKPIGKRICTSRPSSQAKEFLLAKDHTGKKYGAYGRLAKTFQVAR